MYDDGEAVDKSMSKLTNRLPFMELDQICKEEGYSYAAVWRVCGLTKAKAQRVNDKPQEVRARANSRP